MAKGTLYLIPTTLGGETVDDIIPEEVRKKTIELRHFIVENIKSARRYLRKLDRTFPIDDSVFFELNRRTDPSELSAFLAPIYDGNDIGLMSDAGCPGVADPGAAIVSLAHTRKIKLVPFVGPSSILLALMGSGFSGQKFTFHGYLPKERKERINALRWFESDTRKTGTTHLFMDTPFRNMNVLDDLLNELPDVTMLCIASSITLPSESIRSMPIKQWREHSYDLSKKPTIFAIGKNQ
ncbi:MAG: SAM-dependent methyltransferase [Crocinitomicaceae bacterium]|nr:SAM-dependent methyltransferase [Crocinitomicaceae bacterium]